MELTFKDWNIEAMTGYKPMTTLYRDFSIADKFGASAIKDTYKKVMDELKSNYKYLTELVMVLNWKIWEHYNAGNRQYSKLYDELWRKADLYATEHLVGDELSYFYMTTD